MRAILALALLFAVAACTAPTSERDRLAKTYDASCPAGGWPELVQTPACQKIADRLRYLSDVEVAARGL